MKAPRNTGHDGMGRVEGRAQEQQWLRDVVRDVLNAAARDIGEWVQLAERNRKESLDYKHDPSCATDAGIYKSRVIVGRIGRAVAELEGQPEAGKGEGHV